MGLVENLICNGSVLLESSRYNVGTHEEPDIITNNIFAEVIGCYDYGGQFNLDIFVYLSKEDSKSIYETHELYRMPFFEDLNILEVLLREAKEQSHITARER